MKSTYLRFYEELNDLIPDDKRKIRFEHKFFGNPSVKDMIQSFGVPHTEVDLILVNGKAVDFNYRVKDKDEISIYPVFESLDISGIQHLRTRPLRIPSYILDVHLGTLAKYLRMLGFDSLYQNDYGDEQIVKISLETSRTILTKDRGILKRTEVNHGYLVRNEDPAKQVVEVLRRFDLKNHIEQFSRCLECNSLLQKIGKDEVSDMIPEKVKLCQTDFYICSGCKKIYWRGTHYEKMQKIIDNINSSL